MKKAIKILVLLLLGIYFFVDYNRYFIFSKDGSDVFTIWKTVGWDFYIIKGIYIWPFAPKKNYIYSKDQLMNVVFNTNDDYDYKIGVYYKEKKIDSNWNIQVYKTRDSIDFNYNILDSIGFGKRIYPENIDSIISAIDYNVIDVENIYGIKIHH